MLRSHSPIPFFSVTLCLCGFSFRLVADEPLAVLQEQTRAVIAKAEKSVVIVVVSTTPYPNQLPADVSLGKLGGYAARAADGDDTKDLAAPAGVTHFPTGNGIILTAEGLVLVPHHLIDGATKVYVRTSPSRGSYANIHAADARSDLAVLKLIDPPAGLIPASPAPLRPGQPVAAKGDFTVVLAGAGVDGPSASLGLVTATDKLISIPVEPSFTQPPPLPLVAQATLLQSDARTARGVSGGGAFNLKGEWVGMTTALAAVAGSDQAPGFLVPIDSVYRPIIDRLKEGREVEYGFLGITWPPDRPPGFFGRRGGGMGGFRSGESQAPGGGIIIQGITPGMPAEEAGLTEGDVLLAVNGFPISSVPDLQFRVSAALAGGETILTIRRGRSSDRVPVTLAKANNPLPWIASNRPPSFFGLRVDQMSTLLQDLVRNEDRRNQHNFSNLQKGVVVASVEPSSPAAAAFDEPNRRYVITAVNGKPVTSPKEFDAETRGAARVKLSYYKVGDRTARPTDVTLP
jgi:serine protease Do